MKGITPVIAIILLLMITVAIAGFAFVWFSRVASVTANRTEMSINQQQSQMMQTIKIDSYSDTSNSVYIRNTGSVDISSNSIAVYVNNDLAICTWSSNTISPGSVAQCTVAAGFSCGGTVIKVTSPGTPQGDVITC